MTAIGSAEQPLRVAIIGSGPSGFYAAEALLKQKDLTVEVDMYDRLPTPFGLVRGGVAPDHQKIKSVTKVYDKTAANPAFHFYGNVEFGKHITHDDLVQHYHAIIYATGAQTDKRLDVPGEDLPGSHPATEFVAWYNAHPDYRDHKFDLNVEAAAVIGVGNVAMDVTRILARTQHELNSTDIADYAQAALATSSIKTIYVLGRRGPAQAAFTNPEIKELGEMEGADIVVLPQEAELDAYSIEYLQTADDSAAQKNVDILKNYAARAPEGKPKRIVMRFLVSPVEIIGTDRVEAIKIVHNELYKTERGDIRPRATDRTEVLPVGLVFRSVGYQGVALPGVPFYEKWGTIPNDKGRVLTTHESGEQVIGDYVVGWIKRGPSGIIGTNKPDSVETVNMLLEDVQAGKVLSPAAPARAAVEALLRERQPLVVSYADWQAIDAAEVGKGTAQGRPRVKFSRVDDMLDVVQAARQQPNPAGD